MSSPHSYDTRNGVRRSKSLPVLPTKRTISTRNSPVRSLHGGARVGAGRPGKENIRPQVNDAKTTAPQEVKQQEMTLKEIASDIQSLKNPAGRSWSLDECKLLLILMLSLMYHEGMNPTNSLILVAKLACRGYSPLHTLWAEWRERKMVHVTETDNRGAGSHRHINASSHVTPFIVIPH